MSTPVRYKVPSSAANGSQTFADNIVGVQITDGTSQLTNTNFAIDKVISEKDSRDFKTNPFSDFFKLDDLKIEENAPKTTEGTKSKDEKIRFKGDSADAGKSLYGSLKARLGVSVTNIINKFPGGIYIDPTSIVRTSSNTAENISYDSSNNITQFTVQASMFFNPFEITYIQPNSNTLPTSINPIRNLYSSYKKYVLDFSGVTYNIINFSQPNSSNVITIKVLGKPFSDTTYTLPFLIRPNDAITEEFFSGLDDLEQLLLTRNSNPKYQASFKVPRESLDQSKYEISTYYINWPILQDNWNIQISGLDYEKYIYELSSLGDEIDDYKSNLIVRFLTAPQLFEFDTEDQKAQAIFQLYGQSFDRTKKYIDNIAYMRNVTYDGINNVPDILLKNLSETLGFDTHNLFDETSFEQILYTRQPNTYSGLTQGLTIVESEYEIYRRLLVNLAHIYKSKGTRNAIEFFLRFIGAPEPLIKIDEYVYDVVSLPTNHNFEDDIQSLISGTKSDYLISGITITTTGMTYSGATVVTKTNLSRDEYPINENGYPRKIFNVEDDIFFQKGAGWYEMTTNHRSSDVIDYANSVLTGKTKIVKTKPKNFTYGEEYFNYFRKFPGLDYGFVLSSRIDNTKGEVVLNEEQASLVLNRKNLNIFLSPAQAVEYDVWRRSSSLNLTFGNLQPQTNLSFAEYLDNVLNETIKHSNVSKFANEYSELKNLYSSYLSGTGYTPYNFIAINDFIDKMSPRWVKLIEQFIPATTLWMGGNLISNPVFGRSKYKYKKPCQVFEMVDDTYPEAASGKEYFQEEIFKFEPYFKTDNDFNYDGYIQFFPMFEIDGRLFSGSTDPSFIPNQYLYHPTYHGYIAPSVTLTPTPQPTLAYQIDPENYEAQGLGTSSGSPGYFGTTYALLSGSTTVSGICAKLYKGDGTNNFEPDYVELKSLWKKAIIDTVNYINYYSGYTRDAVGVDNSGIIKFTGVTGNTVIEPLISCEFFIDEAGVEKVKFKSYKYGPHTCTVMKSFNFLMAYGTVALDATPTPTPTMTSTMTMTPTVTVTPTNTQTVTPTNTLTPTQSVAPTLTPTVTPTLTQTPTSSPIPVPSIALHTTANCKTTGNCNDNALCEVQYLIDCVNYAAGDYVTLTQTSGYATVSIIDSAPATARLSYSEGSGSEDAYFNLYLRNSGGTIKAEQLGVHISHSSPGMPWNYLSACPSTPVSTTKYIVRKCAGSGGDGVTTYKVDVALSVTVGKTYTLLSYPGGPSDMNGANCWEIIGSVTDTTSPDYTVTYNQEYMGCAQCTPASIQAYSGTTLSIACSQTNPITLYYRGNIVVGMILYTNSDLLDIHRVPTSNSYFWYSDEVVLHVGAPFNDDGQVSEIVSCPPPTPTPTPTPVGVTVGGFMNLSYGSTGPNACSGSSGTIQVYYSSTDLHPGELWSGTTYYDSNGFPFDGSSFGYFSDGINYYGTISSSGYYQQQGTCA